MPVDNQTAGPDRPRQSITYHALAGVPLAKILELPEPLFVGPGTPWRQLEYVDDYVRQPGLACKTIVLEEHYIDRDHMEDHSVFYSKSLRQYSNACRRVHFFSLDEEKLKLEIKRLRALASSEDSFVSACTQFSLLHYIGFAIIKPLPGCPVGRTVLRCLPAESGKGHQRHFDCTYEDTVHLLGLPLRVNGLAFQQQDLGVSACATTALWTSLQKARYLEQGGLATPAQITIRASQFTLPFGRPMPSEGLSLDQMCQAVQSLGYSPNLYRTESFANSFEVSRALLHSSIESGISPVLVMSLQGKNIRHAVAVSGMALAGPRDALAESELGHTSAGLVALYVHDDRNGPYLKTVIRKRQERLMLHLSLRLGDETWILTHILIPMHAKIRLSFRELYTAGLRILSHNQAFVESRLGVKKPSTSWSSYIIRAHKYVESLLRDGHHALVEQICSSLPLSRYLGIIRIATPSLDPFDVLLDTTSTERNLNCLAVVQLQKSNPKTNSLCEFIADQNHCEAFL
jgi:hypothetical protein